MDDIYNFVLLRVAPVIATQASVSALISDDMVYSRLSHKTYLNNLD